VATVIVKAKLTPTSRFQIVRSARKATGQLYLSIACCLMLLQEATK